MLSDIPFKKSYRSDRDNLIKDFYLPCLSNSTLYHRAVGFYSSTALSVAAKGLNVFLRQGGRMQLVASPYLSPSDIDDINEGYRKRAEVENDSLLRALDGQFDQIIKQRLSILAWLIKYQILDIKIALTRRDDNFGIYHEKLGIFSDGRNQVVFTGSPNESSSGLVNNFESIDVFCSWQREDEERVIEKVDNFLKLWQDQTESLKIIPFPEAAKKSLLRFRTDKIPERDPEEEMIGGGLQQIKGIPMIPDNIELRPYQKDAIINWFKANGRGTLKMATGSGKTITALSAAAKLYSEIKLKALIVVCPYKHLVVQWNKECINFGLLPVLCFENKKNWLDDLKAKVYNLTRDNDSFLTVITTNRTFASPSFQNTIHYFPKKTMIVGDEAHNLGATNLVKALSPRIELRLALSATPERWFDDYGTQELLNYFGPVLKPEYTLRDALKDNVLVPYYYYPVFVTLNDEEEMQYIEITREIGRVAALKGVKGDLENSEQLNPLLIKRARILASAHNKLYALREIMSKRLGSSHTLIYCGDGSVEEHVTQEVKRQIDAVCHILGNELNFRVDTYTAETPLEEREELRRQLITGELQGLVAIRCLDEGVDIPIVKTAIIMASSTNPRQFIQRRGRILRRSPGKEYAEIFDMIVVPPKENKSILSIERSILKKELARVFEFADLAKNSGEVRGKIMDIKKRYGILSL